jgi:hypothetical protein
MGVCHGGLSGPRCHGCGSIPHDAINLAASPASLGAIRQSRWQPSSSRRRLCCFDRHRACYSITVASVSGSIRIIKGSIRAILYTESASSADRGHALPESGKTAIHRASKSATIVCAPRIILGFGPRSYSDSKNENPHKEYRYSHDSLLLAALSRQKTETPEPVTGFHRACRLILSRMRT